MYAGCSKIRDSKYKNYSKKILEKLLSKKVM